MSEIPSSNTQPKAPRRSRLAAPLLAALALALVLAATSSALAAAPTAPPPVSILTPTATRPGRHLHLPVRRHRHIRQRPRDPRPERQRRLVPAGSGGTGGCRLPHARPTSGQPVLTWWQGTGLGGLASGTDYIYNDHYQQIATVNAGNGLSADGHEFLITPQNTALILAYTTATRRPHLDRRPVQPDRDRRRRPGDRHHDRQGPVPVEQRRPRALQPERAAAAGLGEHAVGLVPHQRGASSTPTATC